MTEESRSDEEVLRDLAQRLLSHGHPEGEVSVELFVRRLPESSAVDIPLPQASYLLGSSLHSLRGEPTAMQAVFDAEGDLEKSVAAYERELADRGWSAFEGFGMGGGFVPGGMGIGRAFRRGDKGPVLMVAATERQGKPADLRLRLDWEIVRHIPEMRRHGRPDGSERMPPLHPPAGMPMRGGGGGGSGATWHSEATVETDMPVGELQSHFAQHVERAGWSRVAGSADDVISWSSWQLPGDGNWHGILLVLAAQPGERFLYLRIEAGDSRHGGWSISTMALGG